MSDTEKTEALAPAPIKTSKEVASKDVASKDVASPDVASKETQDAQTQVATNLTIQDLTTAMQIITVIGTRGAFKPEEMVIVGALYNKLHAFLKASGALKTPENATAIAGATDTDASGPAK